MKCQCSACQEPMRVLANRVRLAMLEAARARIYAMYEWPSKMPVDGEFYAQRLWINALYDDQFPPAIGWGYSRIMYHVLSVIRRRAGLC